MSKFLQKLMYILPIVTTVVLFIIFISTFSQDMSPRMMSKKVPDFAFHQFPTDPQNPTIISSETLPKKPFMVNIFASWCSTCAREHDVLMELSNTHGITIYGLAYNDTTSGLQKLFHYKGNPYEKVAIAPPVYQFRDWNIKGTPESFLIDADGNIRYHHKGLILEHQVEDLILPILRDLEK